MWRGSAAVQHKQQQMQQLSQQHVLQQRYQQALVACSCTHTSFGCKRRCMTRSTQLVTWMNPANACCVQCTVKSKILCLFKHLLADAAAIYYKNCTKHVSLFSACSAA
jgi:hypothetical protein